MEIEFVMTQTDAADRCAQQLARRGIHTTICERSGEAALQNLWVNDSQPREVILQCFASKPDELPSSSNYGYIGYNVNLDQYTPDFVPEQSFIDLFTESDYRKAVYFDQQRLTFSTGEGSSGASSLILAV